ncbi:MAG: DUF1127 domain-containing protein [Pseudomonadota bacterium]
MSATDTRIEKINAPFAPIARMLSGIAQGFLNIAESNARVREVEHLNRLSDTELARRGLRREDIVRHVFRDVLAV